MYNLKNIMQRAFLYLIFQRGQLVFMWKEITYKFDVLMNTQFTKIAKKKKKGMETQIFIPWKFCFHIFI